MHFKVKQLWCISPGSVPRHKSPDKHIDETQTDGRTGNIVNLVEPDTIKPLILLLEIHSVTQKRTHKYKNNICSKCCWYLFFSCIFYFQSNFPWVLYIPSSGEESQYWSLHFQATETKTQNKKTCPKSHSEVADRKLQLLTLNFVSSPLLPECHELSSFSQPHTSTMMSCLALGPRQCGWTQIEPLKPINSGVNWCRDIEKPMWNKT